MPLWAVELVSFIPLIFPFGSTGDHSERRRTQYGHFPRPSRMMAPRYMSSMTNLMFQMQRQLIHLRRRTGRIERMLRKQNKTSKPVIRIPRLTEGKTEQIILDKRPRRSNLFSYRSNLYNLHRWFGQHGERDELHRQQPKRHISSTSHIDSDQSTFEHSANLWDRNRTAQLKHLRLFR